MTDMFRDPPVPPANPSPAKPVVVGQSNAGVNEPQRRFADQQAAAVAADPWKDPNVVLTRDAEGNIVAQPRRDGGVNGAPTDGDQPASPGDQPQPGTGLVKVGDMEFSADQLKGLAERDALEKSRRALMPATPEEYRTELPADLVLPPGVQVAYSDTDPMVQSSLKSLREFCHANGLGQAEYSRLLALDANRVAIEQKMLQTAHENEMRKLGETRIARLSAVATWLKSMAGEEGGRALISNLLTAKQVAAFESMMHRHQSQGGGSYSGAGRDPGPKPGTLTDEQYGKLSYTEKKEYAAQFQRDGR